MSLDEVLGDKTIETGGRGVSTGTQPQYAQKCVRAGKFVHLDKPPGADLAALRAMLAEAAERKRIVQMGYQWRYHPGMQAPSRLPRKAGSEQCTGCGFRSISRLERRNVANWRAFAAECSSPKDATWWIA